jgi:hypothetical protein
MSALVAFYPDYGGCGNCEPLWKEKGGKGRSTAENFMEYLVVLKKVHRGMPGN